MKVIGVSYQLGIFLCYIGKCHIKHNPSSLSSGRLNIYLFWGMETKHPHSNPQHRASQLFLHAQDGLAGLLTQLISGLEKWAVWSSGLCFNLSQVRLGSLRTAVKTGTLYFMVIYIYQFVEFCTVKNQKDLQTRSSQPDQGFVQFSSQRCL